MKKSSSKGSESFNDYCQYRQKGDGFYPIQKTVKKLPAGFYKPAYDSYTGDFFLQSKKIITPKLYMLPNEAKKIIVEDIQRFWKSEERYRKFQSVYKRNILLYSLPGNGKTCLINIMCQELIDKYDGIIICIDTQRELENYTKVMAKFRQVEPDRKIITIIEDFERLAKDEYFSALLLQILDGNEQLDSIVTIATTNYPENLEKRFTYRPSRFNLVLEYKKPNSEVREFYIYNKLKDGGIDVDSEKVKEDIKRYVEKTDGFTFDFVKEVIQGIYIDDISEDEVFERILKAINNKGNYSVTEDNSKIGFNASGDECCENIIVTPELDADDYEFGEDEPYHPDTCKSTPGIVKGRIIKKGIRPLHEN